MREFLLKPRIKTECRLRGVLRSINESWGGAPHIFALVDPDNRASRNLFERNGFRMIIPTNGNGHQADSLFRRIGGQIPR